MKKESNNLLFGYTSLKISILQPKTCEMLKRNIENIIYIINTDEKYCIQICFVSSTTIKMFWGAKYKITYPEEWSLLITDATACKKHLTTHTHC